jgi:aspartyl-tRNA(Asn)/glutamyl-tRNA(Gln) amidotransferase subunit B
VKNVTYSQRKKESSHDYRYFPDPDLPKLKISEIPEFSRDALKASLPELPWEKRARYMAMGLKEEDARMFSSGGIFGSFFESVLAIVGDNAGLVRLSTNYIAADLAGLVEADVPITLNPTDFADLMKMIDENLISSRGAKDILKIMVESGGAPADIAEKEGLLQQSDEGALMVVVNEIIAANPSVVAEYRAGKEASLQFLIGQGMKVTKGSANPQKLKRLFESTI